MQSDAPTQFREICFEGVRHAFTSRGGKRNYALAELDLRIKANEFVTVVGPSGCGKSTLFNLAAGLLEPTTGRITVNGEALEGVNPYVGFMFQHSALMDWRTVLDNAMIGQEFLGVSRGRAREEAREGFRHFGLSGFENHRPWELSGGMRQRVALLRTYLTQRELLLLDEPFGALDALTRLKMQQFLLDRWQEDQRTVLFITHDVDEALLLGDRVIVLAPRPTYVMTELHVGFQRPRNAEEIMLDPEFVAMKHQLLSLLVPPEAEVDAGAPPAVATNGSAETAAKQERR